MRERESLREWVFNEKKRRSREREVRKKSKDILGNKKIIRDNVKEREKNDRKTSRKRELIDESREREKGKELREREKKKQRLLERK